MTHDTLQSTIDELDDLLDRERTALIAGDLDGLTRLHDHKAGLIDALSRFDAKDADGLSDLNAKVERNQALLDSALDGIRSVARRLAAIRRVRQSLDTYDARGKKSCVDMGVDRSVEKRA